MAIACHHMYNNAHKVAVLIQATSHHAASLKLYKLYLLKDRYSLTVILEYFSTTVDHTLLSYIVGMLQ